MDKIVIARGIAMPFFPIRPGPGTILRNQGSVADFVKNELNTDDWVVQPKLEGDRACVGVLNKTVYIQNRHGGWYTKRVNNLADFKKLPSGTVLDGEVYKGNFYAFDCLSVGDKSYLMHTASEREVMALHVTKLLNHDWMFKRPSERWVSALRDNMPVHGGVVIKRWKSPYIIQGSAGGFSLDWLKNVWG